MCDSICQRVTKVNQGRISFPSCFKYWDNGAWFRAKLTIFQGLQGKTKRPLLSLPSMRADTTSTPPPTWSRSRVRVSKQKKKELLSSHHDANRTRKEIISPFFLVFTPCLLFFFFLLLLQRYIEQFVFRPSFRSNEKEKEWKTKPQTCWTLAQFFFVSFCRLTSRSIFFLLFFFNFSKKKKTKETGTRVLEETQWTVMKDH